MGPNPNIEKPRIIDRLDWLATAGVFASALLLYVHTLANTLLLGDSGEFQALAATLGLAHGTGYPVYILITRIFTLLAPVKDIAYRVNLFSAVTAALCLALIFLCARALGSRRIPALVGVTALGLSRLFWWHAVIAELYDPACALIALVLLLVLLWRRTGEARLLFWAGLAGGLSLGVHYLVLLTAPAVLIYLALCAPRESRKRTWGYATAGALLGAGLTFAAFMGLDTLNAPSTNFRAIMYPSLSVLDITPEQAAAPLGRIWYLASGKQFQGELFSLPPKRVLSSAASYRDAALAQFPWTVLVLAGVGALSMLVPFGRVRARWRELLLIATAWTAMFAYIINYDIGDIFVFYIPSYIPIALLASQGASALVEGLAWLLARLTPAQVHPAQWTAGLVGLAFIAATAWPALPDLQKSWQQERITFLDNSEYRDYPYPVRSASWPHILAKSIARLVEDNAIIFTDWSMVYPIYYVAHVEEGRTGIAVHETYPAMKPKPFAESAIAYIHENYGRRPIYFTFEIGELAGEYRFVQVAGQELYRLEKK